MQFAARQRGFEQVRGVNGTFCRPGAHNGVQFVYKHNYVTRSVLYFLQHRFEAVFKLSAILGPGHQRADVKREQFFVFQTFGDVVAHNALGKSLHDSGFPHACLANKYGVVFRAASEHLHNATNFVLAPNDGVKLFLSRLLGEVIGVFFKYLKFVLGVGIGDAHTTAQFAQYFKHAIIVEWLGLSAAYGRTRNQAGFAQQFLRTARCGHQCQQQVLYADIFV
jgi:hypothetical protein